jgi:hypothetical protein
MFRARRTKLRTALYRERNKPLPPLPAEGTKPQQNPALLQTPDAHQMALLAQVSDREVYLTSSGSPLSLWSGLLGVDSYWSSRQHYRSDAGREYS